HKERRPRCDLFQSAVINSPSLNRRPKTGRRESLPLRLNVPSIRMLASMASVDHASSQECPQVFHHAAGDEFDAEAAHGRKVYRSIVLRGDFVRPYSHGHLVQLRRGGTLSMKI